MNDTPPATSKEAIDDDLDWLDEPDLVPPMERTTEANAARLRAFGFEVFPCNGKRPKVDWQDPAPKDGWPFAENDQIGVRLTGRQVVLDIDNPEAFEATGHEAPPSTETSTLTPGHRHVFYQMDEGRTIRQTQGGPDGYDTRVAGKGYVIAWHPEDWTAPETWAPAPAWLYERPKAKAANHDASQDGPDWVVPAHTRDAYLTSIAGFIRSKGAGPTHIKAALRGLAPIVPTKTDADFERIATSVSNYATNVAEPVSLGTRTILDLPCGPTPPQFIGPYLDPEGPTMVYAKGGTGKGLFACLMIGMLVQCGHTVVILDYENHPGEWGRRIRAMGLAPLQMLRQVHYRSPYDPEWKGPKGTIGKIAQAFREECDRLGATYVIIDSYLASTGADAAMGGLNGANEYFAALTTIGRPSLTLAHVAGEAKRFPPKPYGSVHVYNQCRETWAVESAIENAETDDLMPQLGKPPVNLELRMTKKSTDGKRRPQFVNFLFPYDGRIIVSLGRPFETKSQLDTIVEILTRDAENDEPGMTTADIAKVYKADHGTDISVNRIRTIFSNNKGTFETIPGSNPQRWRLSPPRDLGLAGTTGGGTSHRGTAEREKGAHLPPKSSLFSGQRCAPNAHLGAHH